MYKTIWLIEYEDNKTTLIQYHFRKEPKFPSWYMENGVEYKIEATNTLKLVKTFDIFMKCLTKTYIIK